VNKQLLDRRRLLASGVAALALSATTAWAGTAASAQATITDDSIYQLGVPLTDQAGRAFSLADKRGTPMVVSMFYTSCQFVCPMLIDAIRATEEKLSPAERRHLNVLLVSFDPVHDTVEVLRKTAGQRQLDAARWALARTDAKNVRKLAAMLDIQYRALDNGDFNHSTALVLIDGNGRVAARTSDLAGSDPAFVKRVKAVLASASP
jgi:protein SCO1/2